MESPENAGQPETPAPTHWNTRRDPVKSFQCPFCGTRIVLVELYGGDEMFGPGNMYCASCSTCHQSVLRDTWRSMKEKEMSRGS